MAGSVAATTAMRDEVGLYPQGAAFIDGACVPIEEARIPILDWGFVRSDCT